jgi:hypothetical protein
MWVFTGVSFETAGRPGITPSTLYRAVVAQHTKEGHENWLIQAISAKWPHRVFTSTGRLVHLQAVMWGSDRRHWCSWRADGPRWKLFILLPPAERTRHLRSAVLRHRQRSRISRRQPCSDPVFGCRAPVTFGFREAGGNSRHLILRWRFRALVSERSVAMRVLTHAHCLHRSGGKQRGSHGQP